MLISICIPTYEDVDALRRAVNSIMKQSVSNWECIITDDSKTDNIRKFMSTLSDQRIKYYRNEKTKGVPQNWNKAIEIAKGNVINLLHQDDFYENDNVLNCVLTAFNQKKSKIVVCGRSLWENQKKVSEYINNKLHVINFEKDFPSRSLVVNRIGTPSVIFIHNSLKQIEFDCQLKYFVDTEWYYRLLSCTEKNKIEYIQESLIACEMGRKNQLSSICLNNLSTTSIELKKILVKYKANNIDIALAYARFFSSYIRYWKSFYPKEMRNILQEFTIFQKIIFTNAFILFSCHMIYRFVRRCLHMRWG